MEKRRRKIFRFRAFVSLLTALGFGMAVLSGVLLFIAPSGRGVRWMWTLLGLNRHQWEEMHIWFCLLFAVAGTFHLSLNWRPMLHYLKIVGSKTYGFRFEWLAVLAISAVVFAGTYYQWKPFAALLEFRQQIQGRRQAPAPDVIVRPDGAKQNRAGIGQMTLMEYCAQTGLEPSEAVQTLQKKGVPIRPEMTMRQIAELTGVHPSQVPALLTAP